jgi:hypothetical protein
LVALHATGDPHGEWAGQNSTNTCVCPEGEFVRVLNVVSVLPGPSLGSGHVLTGVKTDPWVIQELIVQPIISNYNLVVMEEQQWHA